MNHVPSLGAGVIGMMALLLAGCDWSRISHNNNDGSLPQPSTPPGNVGDPPVATPHSDIADTGAATWSPTVRHIDTGGNAGSQPALAVNASGNAIVVFKSGTNDIRGCWYRPDKDWCASSDLLDNSDQPVRDPSVALAANGDAVAGWQQQSAGVMRMVAGLFASDQNRWLAPQIVDFDATNNEPAVRSGPRVALGGGQAIAALFQQRSGFSGRTNAIFFNCSVLGSTNPAWAGAQSLGVGDDMQSIEIAMDPRGDAAIVHLDMGTDPSSPMVFAHYYPTKNACPVNTDWPPRMLSADGSANTPPTLSMNAGGYAVAVWASRLGETQTIWSSCHPPGDTVWRPSRSIETDPLGTSDHPQIQLFDSTTACGPALAVWEEELTGTYSLHFARLTASGSWLAEQAIPTGLDDARNPRLALNSHGAGFLLFRRQNGGQGDLWVMRYKNGDWGTPRPLEEGPDDVVNYRIGVDDNDIGVAVWEQAGAIRAVQLQ